MTRLKGFTLIEMLVTVGIFAMLGVISAQILGHSVQVTEKIIDRSERLMETQLAMSVMSRDFSQYVTRSVRDELGDRMSALILDDGLAIEFTRAGWTNPTGALRSNLQRVSYHIAGGSIYRRYWQVLDRAHDTEPIEQLLLTNVERAAFAVIDETGDEHYFWPPVVANPNLQSPRPIGIKFSLDITPFSNIGRHWLLAMTPADDDENKPLDPIEGP